jgi:DNA-binding NtrC family response regulator
MAQILIIDDEPDTLATLKAILELEGHEVFVALNGKAGIQSYSECRPELVICDLFMPIKNGLETIHELRGRFGDVKIIAISGGGHIFCWPDSLQMAEYFGALKSIAKPFHPHQLSILINEVLAGGNYVVNRT